MGGQKLKNTNDVLLNNKEELFFLNEKPTWQLCKIYNMHIVIAAADGDSSCYWLQTARSILNISPSLARVCPSELIENCVRTSIDAAINRPARKRHLAISSQRMARRRSSLRRTTSVLSKRSDVSQCAFRQFRPSHRPACDDDVSDSILYIATDARSTRGRFVAACTKSRTNATVYDDRQFCGCMRVCQNWQVTSENSSRHLIRDETIPKQILIALAFSIVPDRRFRSTTRPDSIEYERMQIKNWLITIDLRSYR